MAITVIETPDKFTPAFNPVVFSISSDNYAQPDFKFVVDVYSGTGQLLVTLKYQPQVAGNEPIDFDISRNLHELVAANYCKLNEVAGADIVVTGAGAISGYSVQFGEQYNNVVHANLTSYSGYIFNAAMNNKRFAFYSQATYLNKQFLTRFPRQVVRKRDSVILSILQSDAAAMANFGLTIYNMAGTILYSDNINNPYTSLANTSNRALHLHAGFDHLYSIVGFSTAIYNAAAYYTITPPGGNTMRLDLYSQCERFPGVRLYFLNELGGFDSFNFMLASRPEQTNEKKTYQRQAANRRTAYDATNRRFEATVRNYSTSYTEKLKVISDYLTDTESELLEGLMYSPLVYQEVAASEYGGPAGQNILIPVDMKMQDYTRKQTRVDKMFNLEADIELTYTNYMQSI
ncbi:hypothetical protein FHW36_10670 [Chitinophaga polysaccharea]|uniref:Uncharacterized protein n=1 Tax=Chitinophaga polysaccharea TaxID=1293035 RepID=A0A561PL59_9BACT|nr:hypothetical protein [Chitinophaga polysaccharea]TWF38847.1 hypothetical protein FHW36_10670 [Chitinophaga polysaccharea]